MFNLLIDKLAVVFTIPEDGDMNDHYACVLNFIYGMGSEGHQVWKLKYVTRCSIDLGAGNKLLIQAGISHHRLYIKFEFNPNKLGEIEWVDLYSYMSLLMDYGYHSLYKAAKVNYIEIAADAPNVEFNSIFIYDEKLRSANNTYKGVGTTYLGGETSSRQFIVYDKAKQIKDCSGIKLDYPLTRIEARLAHLPLTLGQLHALPNPFKSLRVGWVADLLNKNGDSGWGLFKKQCKTMGVQNAIGMAGKSRKRILEMLGEVESPKLNPGSYWDQYPATLGILKPPAFIY